MKKLSNKKRAEIYLKCAEFSFCGFHADLQRLFVKYKDYEFPETIFMVSCLPQTNSFSEEEKRVLKSMMYLFSAQLALNP